MHAFIINQIRIQDIVFLEEGWKLCKIEKSIVSKAKAELQGKRLIELILQKWCLELPFSEKTNRKYRE